MFGSIKCRCLSLSRLFKKPEEQKNSLISTEADVDIDGGVSHGAFTSESISKHAQKWLMFLSDALKPFL